VSEALTQGIRIKVRTEYRAERSNPTRKVFFFAYTVRIHNEGPKTVQLISRHWVITDANGHEEEVKGPGVVGEQPVLRPGGSFEYTSGCPLPTEFGTMHGTYQMRGADGAEFDAVIAPFRLAFPHAVN
jgi:ApaG protein